MLAMSAGAMDNLDCLLLPAAGARLSEGCPTAGLGRSEVFSSG